VLEGVPVWLVTRYEDVRRLLADVSVSSDPLRAGPATRAVPWVQQADNPHPLVRSMVRVDPPEHTRLRKLTTRAFTARRVEALRPRVRQIVGELMETMLPRGHADLIGDFALPLPFTVIRELLGVPEDGHDEFLYWSNVFLGVDENEFHRRPEALRYLTGFLETLIEQKISRRASTARDGNLLDVLIAADDKGDRLSRSELLSLAFLLLAAGYETTASLIGNGMLALLYHPAELAALRADPGLIGTAIEEFLRYDSPVKIAPALRFTTAEVRVAGTVIPPGETLLLFLSAANRDADRFRRPDMLDVSRDAGGHMAFGHGVHYCLGAPLARIQAQAAFTALITGLDGLAPGPGGPAWRYSFQLHSLKSLPVTFTATG
jgi:cytochrome P450